MNGLKKMNLQTSLYEFEEVLFTLAWLLKFDVDNNNSPQTIISRAEELDLITVHNESNWKANEKEIFILLNETNIDFPKETNIGDLAKILMGLGEFSARCHGDFDSIVIKQFSNNAHKESLIKIMKNIIETHSFFKRNRSLDEIAYSQKIAETEFDWKNYYGVIGANGRDYINGSGFSYGLTFFIKLCAKLVPYEFSTFVERNKEEDFSGDLCRPLIEVLFFRNKEYAPPLLKSKNVYLKLLACGSVVSGEPFDKTSTIKENIETLVIAGVDIGDAIWLCSAKLKDQYISVERIKSQLTATNHEILKYERGLDNSLEGNQSKEMLSYKRRVLEEHEGRLISSVEILNESLNALKNYWPQLGLESNQIENIIQLIRNEKLTFDLVPFISTRRNQEQVLDNIFTSINRWIGISSPPLLITCNITFTYNSHLDFERVLNAAKTLLQLTGVKKKLVGKFLGNIVKGVADDLENFISSPCMDVRKPNLWESTICRLGCIHLLAMCVFENIEEKKESEISQIVPIVVDKVNLLLKIKGVSIHYVPDELFRDLKRVTAHIISSKEYMSEHAKKIVLDTSLPSDYRIRVIATSENLLKDDVQLLLDLFEEVSSPPIYYDHGLKQFSEYLNLLDICIAHLWKFKAKHQAKEIIRIWECYCPLYGEECSRYIEYAQRLYAALLTDGDDRVWLNKLNGFEDSYCFNFLIDNQ